MKAKTKMNLVEGALVGAALGIAAGIVLAPESGKKFRTDIKKKSAEFHAHLAPHIKRIKALGETEYNAFVQQAMKVMPKQSICQKAKARIWSRMQRNRGSR